MAGMVIIGAGHAAGQAAASLRQEKYTGPITIIGDEPHLPYQRPPLSKAYLSGSQEVERVYLRGRKILSGQRHRPETFHPGNGNRPRRQSC